MKLQFKRNCNLCGDYHDQKGGGVRIVQNFRQWVCKKCRDAIDKAKK